MPMSMSRRVSFVPTLPTVADHASRLRVQARQAEASSRIAADRPARPTRTTTDASRRLRLMADALLEANDYGRFGERKPRSLPLLTQTFTLPPLGFQPDNDIVLIFAIPSRRY